MIEFIKIPDADTGGPSKVDLIKGRVNGAKPGQRIVIYARSGGVWWVQPFVNKPYTEIQADAQWSSSIHLGMEYAALLVEPGYEPLPTIKVLPERGGKVVAIAIAKGKGLPPPVAKTLHFSGYDWDVRQEPSRRGGKVNPYRADNAWIDAHGFLHLRVTRMGSEWACAEVSLKQSLGRGLYLFTVSDSSRLDPAAVMTLFTYDLAAADQHHREIDIEISRWGEPAGKNAQYLVQPYYEPENVVRFSVPPGPLIYSFRWEPGRVAFKTVRAHPSGSEPGVVAEHVFSSGVPSPGGESVLMNLYAFGNSPNPMQIPAEVTIEKFEYLP